MCGDQKTHHPNKKTRTGFAVKRILTASSVRISHVVPFFYLCKQFWNFFRPVLQISIHKHHYIPFGMIQSRANCVYLSKISRELYKLYLGIALMCPGHYIRG